MASVPTGPPRKGRALPPFPIRMRVPWWARNWCECAMSDDKTPRDLLDWLGITDAPRWWVARPLGPLVSVLLAILLVLAVVAAFAVLLHTVAMARSGASEGINLGAGALIVALLGAPFLIWSTVLKHQTLRYQKEGHITDRINKAVEQLGAEKDISRVMRNVRYTVDGQEHVELEGKDERLPLPAEATDVTRGDWEVVKRTVPNIEVRIGAILSLERIAQDSTRYDRGRDHVRVMEILCAYVRENAPAKNLDATPTPFKTKKPRQDIQIALTVIKRRSAEQAAIEKEQRYRVDLRETDLDGCDLSNGDFTGALFWRSRLEGASLKGANLTGSDFSGSLMNYVDFFDSQLRGTVLNEITVPKQHTMGGLALANLNSALIEDACLPELRITISNYRALFGSKGTQISTRQCGDKELALEELLRCPIDQPMRYANQEIPQISGKTLFLHWNPYTINDGAAVRIRHQFFSMHHLYGWPFLWDRP